MPNSGEENWCKTHLGYPSPCTRCVYEKGIGTWVEDYLAWEDSR